MLNILIVDDEPRHRRCLKSIIKNYKAEYEILEAKNGKEALEIADSQHLDIVFTDIKMPIMDGLTFVSSLGDKVKTIKIIILSGFASFEYAQKALSLGATDFLLKPFSEEDVKKVLAKVEYEIDYKKIEAKERECLKKQLDEMMPQYLEHSLNNWIFGNISGFEEEKLQKLFPNNGSGIVLLLEISGHEINGETYTISELNEIRSNIKIWMKEALFRVGHPVSFYMGSNENILVTILEIHMQDFSLSESFIATLSEMIANLNKSYGLGITIGIGSVHENIFKNVIKSYEDAVKSLSLTFYEGTGHVLKYTISSGNIPKQNILKFEQVYGLKQAIREHNYNKIKSLVKEFFARLRRETGLLPLQFKEVIINMVGEIIKSFEHLLQGDYYNSFILEKKDELYNCKTYYDLQQKVEELLLSIVEDCNSYSSSNEKTVIQCKKYIDEHYMDDLSLEYLAEKVNLNTNYFSVFFKNNLGVKFTQYLQDIRMNKARELLEKGDMRIYEISEMIGYHDVKYFIKVFKKEFDISPDEYRQSINQRYS